MGRSVGSVEGPPAGYAGAAGRLCAGRGCPPAVRRLGAAGRLCARIIYMGQTTSCATAGEGLASSTRQLCDGRSPSRLCMSSDDDGGLCGACGDNIMEMVYRECEHCGQDLHNPAVCDDVWAPHALYCFCNKGCAAKYLRAHPGAFGLVKRVADELADEPAQRQSTDAAARASASVHEPLEPALAPALQKAFASTAAAAPTLAPTVAAARTAAPTVGVPRHAAVAFAGDTRSPPLKRCSSGAPSTAAAAPATAAAPTTQAVPDATAPSATAPTAAAPVAAAPAAASKWKPKRIKLNEPEDLQEIRGLQEIRSGLEGAPKTLLVSTTPLYAHTAKYDLANLNLSATCGAITINILRVAGRYYWHTSWG